jgi:hypothetical protein
VGIRVGRGDESNHLLGAIRAGQSRAASATRLRAIRALGARRICAPLQLCSAASSRRRLRALLACRCSFADVAALGTGGAADLRAAAADLGTGGAATARTATGMRARGGECWRVEGTAGAERAMAEHLLLCTPTMQTYRVVDIVVGLCTS